MRSLRTPAIVLVLLALLGVAGTACSAVQSPAMTVNGRVYSDTDLFADLAKADTTGKTKGAYTTTAIASQLTQKAFEDIVSSGLADLGVPVTDDDRSAAEALLSQAQSSVDPNLAAAQVAMARRLGQDAVDRGAADLDAVARAVYDEDKAQMGTPDQTCVAVVIVVPGGLDSQGQPTSASPTPAQVDAAKAKGAAAEAALAGGATIEAVQAQYSDVPADQATVCTTPGQLPSELEALVTPLTVGQNSKATYVESQGAVFLFHLTSIKPGTPAPSFESQADTYRAKAVIRIGANEFRTWLDQQNRTAVVRVNERYGTWDPASGTVVPPEKAPVPTTRPADDVTQLLGQGSFGGPSDTSTGTPETTPVPETTPAAGASSR